MNKFFVKLLTFAFALPFIALCIISLICIEGPGALEFFSQHPVFKWLYVITHFFSNDGFFLIHIGA